MQGCTGVRSPTGGKGVQAMCRGQGACSGVTEDWSGLQGGQVVSPLVVVVAGFRGLGQASR